MAAGRPTTACAHNGIPCYYGGGAAGGGARGALWRRQRQGRRLGCQAPSHAAAPATAELRQAEAINYSTKGGGRLNYNGPRYVRTGPAAHNLRAAIP